MKLEPRTRTKVALFELDADSNYRILFRKSRNSRKGVSKSKPIEPKKEVMQATARKRTAALSQIVHAVKAANFGAAPPNKSPPLATTSRPANPTSANNPSSGLSQWQFRMPEANHWTLMPPSMSHNAEMAYQKWLSEGKPHGGIGIHNFNFSDMTFGSQIVCHISRI